MWVNSMLMTRDNPSIATKVNTMTSSVIILLLGNAPLRYLCHRSVKQEKIIDSGVAELMQRAYLSCLCRGLFSIPLFFWSPPCLRDLFRTQVRRSQSHGFKARVVSYAFSSTSQCLGSSARTSEGWVVLQCKIALWYASKTFPMEFLVRELVSGSRLVWEQNVSQLLILQWQCVQYLGLL